MPWEHNTARDTAVIAGVAVSRNVQIRLTQMLLQQEGITTMPVLSVNDTLLVKLGLNLLKIIHLVCTHDLFLKVAD